MIDGNLLAHTYTDLNWNWWKVLNDFSEQEIDSFFSPSLQTDLIAGVARCVLSQTSDKLKYFVVKLIYIDWKEK